MNVYVATSLKARADASALAKRIKSLDLRVVSRWHEELVLGEDENVPEADLPHEVLERISSGNHRDLGEADTLVLMVRPKMQGSLVELGCALGAGKRVLVIGERKSVTPMVRHDRTWWCANEQACIDTLARLSGRGRPTAHE